MRGYIYVTSGLQWLQEALAGKAAWLAKLKSFPPIEGWFHYFHTYLRLKRNKLSSSLLPGHPWFLEQWIPGCILYSNQTDKSLLACGPSPHQFGKNSHISRISNSMTHLRSFINAKHLQNSYPNAAKLHAIKRGEQLWTYWACPLNDRLRATAEWSIKCLHWIIGFIPLLNNWCTTIQVTPRCNTINH